MKLEIINPIHIWIDKISKNLTKGNLKVLNYGIWHQFDNNKISEIDLTLNKNYYKQFNNIIQAFNLFKNNDIFCVNYNLIEGCSICSKTIESKGYLDPYIQINETDLIDNISLEYIIRKRLQNYYSSCPNSDYNIDKKIISQNYFKLFSNISIQYFLFINFEFNNISQSILGTNLELEIREYNKRIQNNKKIIEYLFEEKIVFKHKFKLIGIINTPSNDHYNEII